MLGNVKTLARLLGLPYLPVTPTFPWLGPLGAGPAADQVDHRVRRADPDRRLRRRRRRRPDAGVQPHRPGARDDPADALPAADVPALDLLLGRTPPRSVEDAVAVAPAAGQSSAAVRRQGTQAGAVGAGGSGTALVAEPTGSLTTGGGVGSGCGTETVGTGADAVGGFGPLVVLPPPITPSTTPPIGPVPVPPGVAVVSPPPRRRTRRRPRRRRPRHRCRYWSGRRGRRARRRRAPHRCRSPSPRPGRPAGRQPSRRRTRSGPLPANARTESAGRPSSAET